MTLDEQNECSKDHERLRTKEFVVEYNYCPECGEELD